MMAKCKLTISMLVCGRDTTIRCLDSLVPILEGLDAELILVDPKEHVKAEDDGMIKLN